MVRTLIINYAHLSAFRAPMTQAQNKLNVRLTLMVFLVFIPPSSHCWTHGKVNNLPLSMPVAHPTNRVVTSKRWNSWSGAWMMNVAPLQVGSVVILPHSTLAIHRHFARWGWGLVR